MLRKLTIEEINFLTSKQGVKKTAVENFLISLTVNDNKEIAIANLNRDAKLYKWNTETKEAICEGIKLSVKKKVG